MKRKILNMLVVTGIIFLYGNLFSQQKTISDFKVTEDKERIYLSFNSTDLIKFDTVTYIVGGIDYPVKKIVDIKNIGLFSRIEIPPVNIYPVNTIRINKIFDDIRIVFDLKEDTGLELYQDSSYVSIELMKKEEKVKIVPEVVKTEKIEAELEKEQEIREKIPINYIEEPIKNVIRAFMEFYKFNIVISPEVRDQNVTVRLEIDPNDAESALEAILMANNLNYLKKDDILIIKGRDQKIPGEMMSEIFKLEYADANDLKTFFDNIKSEEGKVEVYKRNPIGEVGVTLPQRGSSSGGGTGGAAAGGTQMGGGQVTPAPTMGGGAGARGGGGGGTTTTAASEGRSDILLVIDYPYIVDRIKTLIKELDVKIPQIRIEVKFVETTLDEKEKWGINWTAALEAVGKGGQATNQMSGMMGRGVGGTAGTAGATTTAGGTGAAAAGIGQVQGLPLKISSFQFGTLSFSQLKIMLELLEQRGDSKLLNQPSITTLDNQQADIAIGTLLKIETTQMGGGMGMPGQAGMGGAAMGGMGGMGGMGAMGGMQMITKTYQDEYVSIRLTVIPKVNEQKYVTLWLKPVVQEITGFTGERSDIPIISDRTANTQIRIKDGDSVVIGGLIKEDKIKTQRKVRFLGDIPLLGNLFRHTSIDSKRSELIIFITPIIIKEEIAGE